jgi:hypothetical protein
MSSRPPVGPDERSGKGRWQLSTTVRSSAPVEVVWPLIGEAERWKEWSWMTRAYLLRPGAPDPNGVGALRRFGIGPGGSREEVVAWEPPHHLGYIAVSGLPVRHYRSDVELRRDGDGTVISWEGSFDELVPGTGTLIRVILQKMVGGFARRVGRYAESLPRGAD